VVENFRQTKLDVVGKIYLYFILIHTPPPLSLPPSFPPSLPQALAFVGIDNSPKALQGHFLALLLILAASYVVTYLGLSVRARYFSTI